MGNLRTYWKKEGASEAIYNSLALHQRWHAGAINRFALNDLPPPPPIGGFLPYRRKGDNSISIFVCRTLRERRCKIIKIFYQMQKNL